MDETVSEQARRIGGRIRALRRSRRLTLVQVASETDLSHSFLSQLERGRSLPSIGSLDRIARALGTSQLELLAVGEDEAFPPSPPDTCLVRAGEGTRGAFGLNHGRMLASGRSKFHPVELSGDNVEPGEYIRHAEDEFLYVIAGSVAVDLDGRPIETLTVGDSLYFEGGTGHRWSAGGSEPYRLLIVKEKPTPR